MSEKTQKPKILVARSIFPDILERLQEVAEVESNQSDRIWEPEALRQALVDKDAAIITGSEPIGEAHLKTATHLKIISNIAVGYNNLDLAALKAANILATNTPDVLTETTADFGFALLMATARRVTETEHWLRAGHWKKFSICDTPLAMDIHHSNLGIMGMGRIGQAIAKRASGFSMNVMYHNRSRLSPDLEQECGARYVDRDTLLKESDHIILVMPYTPENHHLFGEKELSLMKPTATLINIARGGIVDELALAKALKEKRIFAAGIDVFEGEPTVRSELLALSNVVLSPHIASATEKTRRAMIELAIKNCLAGLAGLAPPNLIVY
ncbi:D-glycerate dehydrogenase [Polynucleobacter sp. MWH-Spelu-300-X4]|uniref:2-hydroxyacid dehydrogenase n=1 Tax=Polynucleobacter sp. MWH-Spelu-300-X4 TaxID=2689109 RepID=UPI001BFDB13F|nr:D-glycerate dehydrogenase [Polynucleobacter sp. MWH-Spelu-300-X4]QWD80267.1 D-glycerate dehydrogenase [Polynucleobacter sp. MWH-Spelu-300-X4]